MQGFYSKQEAAAVLSVTARQITNYIQDGKLRKAYHGRRVWIPHEDVHAMYENSRRSLVPQREELAAVEKRLKRLEETIEVLKLGMGFGAKRPPLSKSDLLLLRDEVLRDLSSPGWLIGRISEIADIFMSLREEDLQTLCALKGSTAWTPLFDLSNRMVNFLEAHESYPECGTGTLRERLLKSRDRLLGLIQASTKIDTALPRLNARELQKQVDIVPNQIDTFVARYILRKST
jgi:excisionase family DNA binding protein